MRRRGSKREGMSEREEGKEKVEKEERLSFTIHRDMRRDEGVLLERKRGDRSTKG